VDDGDVDGESGAELGYGIGVSRLSWEAAWKEKKRGKRGETHVSPGDAILDAAFWDELESSPFAYAHLAFF
jgi:hypothetical protein